MSGFSDCPGNRLTNPPGSVRGKLIPHRIIKLVNGAHQSDISLLYQIQEWNSMSGKFFGNAYDKAQIRFNQLVFCCLITPGDTLCKFLLLLCGKKRHISDFLQIHTNRIIQADTGQNILIIQDLNSLRILIRLCGIGIFFAVIIKLVILYLVLRNFLVGLFLILRHRIPGIFILNWLLPLFGMIGSCPLLSLSGFF